MGQDEVLSLLKKNPSGLTVNEMVKFLNIDRSSVTTSCTTLFKRNRVKRRYVIRRGRKNCHIREYVYWLDENENKFNSNNKK